MAASKKKDGLGLAIVFGKPKGGGKPPPADDEMMAEDEYVESEELPPDFEDYAMQAFPDLDGDPDRTMALWKAIQACMKA